MRSDIATIAVVINRKVNIERRFFFESVLLGPLVLLNRVFMAPLTRNRANADGVPTELAVQYYAQRASAGLIITEATQISPMGKGYVNTSGNSFT